MTILTAQQLICYHFRFILSIIIGDEILDIHGVTIFNKTVAEVVNIIKQSPTEFLATVRPIASVHKALKNDFRRINYSSIVHKPTDSNNDKTYDTIEVNDSNTSNNGYYEYATVKARNERAGVRERRERENNAGRRVRENGERGRGEVKKHIN